MAPTPLLMHSTTGEMPGEPGAGSLRKGFGPADRGQSALYNAALGLPITGRRKGGKGFDDPPRFQLETVGRSRRGARVGHSELPEPHQLLLVCLMIVDHFPDLDANESVVTAQAL